MRKHIIAGNWKMNTELGEALALFTEVKTMAKDELDLSQVDIIVFPPFTYLFSLKQLNDTALLIGAQNVSWEDKGAFTGEVSARMLRSVGATHVILGHSERRQVFGEDNSMLIKKINVALENSLTPVFCVGETAVEREAGKQVDVIRKQLKDGLFHLEAESFKKLILAYEPVWAIGTGLTASPGQAQEIHAAIRSFISGHFNDALARDLTILYGGSCNTKNAAELFGEPDIDGGLIGGASLKARDFIDIAKTLTAVKNTQ